MTSPIIIIGAGLGGLWTALNFSAHKVLVINAGTLGKDAASAWAQGGIAAAFGKTDSPNQHLADTKTAGGGINDEKILNLLTNNIQSQIKKLEKFGIQFDQTKENDLQTFLLSREAGHSHRRIVRSAGDMAGKAIMSGLSQAVIKANHIEIIENTFVGRLALDHNQKVVGVFAKNNKSKTWQFIRAAGVVIATGGIGQLYQMTTNPPLALGLGLGLGARAGAELADSEFVQFHPTALDIGLHPAPLATEALRGEGALLVNKKGHRFMLEAHQAAELAPRDVVAREVARAVQGGGAFLDCSTITSVALDEHFPLICSACARAGLDPKQDLIPVAPAAHYHMGGIACDEFGRTALDGLWVCGESAANGAHGANRLAGNSLGEALVFAHFIAETLEPKENTASPKELNEKKGDSNTKEKLKVIMSTYVNVVREQAGLLIALDKIRALEEKNEGAVLNENMLAAAKVITASALQRTESRGAHFRIDYPHPNPAYAQRSKCTLAAINAMV